MSKDKAVKDGCSLDSTYYTWGMRMSKTQGKEPMRLFVTVEQEPKRYPEAKARECRQQGSMGFPSPKASGLDVLSAVLAGL